MPILSGGETLFWVFFLKILSTILIAILCRSSVFFSKLTVSFTELKCDKEGSEVSF